MTFSYIKQDIFASITVALVAIPLCLGIALASGVPLFSGILTGIIGGIVVGFISGSKVSVSGPAAGMIAVTISVIAELGSFELFLLSLTIAGFLQIIAGIFRGGFIANYIPTNVIQGLLAAIGILIIIKQLPIALGYYHDSASVNLALEHTEKTLSIPYLFSAISHINGMAILITLCSLIILLSWEKYLPKLAKIIPASVMVVFCAIMINMLSKVFIPGLTLQSFHLVNMPLNKSFSEFLSQLKFPDFSALSNIKVYTYAAMIAVMASLETLMCLEGIEKIDKKHRYTSRNLELVAQGFGNIFSGLLGGLPITSVIIRSSANIYAGAKTKLSTILHGFILLASITLIPKYLNDIPLAALAAILIHTGYKLSSLNLFKKAYGQGMRYFIPFLITVISIIFTNLLTGILIGLTVSILFILHYNSKNSLLVVNESHASGEVLRFILPQQITFLNKAAIIDELNKIPNKSNVLIDANSTDYIDTDVLGVIKEFKDEQAPEKNIRLNISGLKDYYEIKNQVNFINATTYDVQMKLTHKDALKILMEGNKRFMNGTPIHKDYKHQIKMNSHSQHPIGVILGCIDSRVPVEIIFDLTLGDLFVARVAGNIANVDIVASIEYACKVAQTKLVIVLGHRECGAIKAACENFQMGNITQLIEKIKPAIEMEKATGNLSENKETFLDHVIENNVKITKSYLFEHSTILKDMFSKNEINIIGAIYNIHTGEVLFNSIEFS
ncbi:MAG: SulP family inorganic anion transporter [Coxiellaceae bacterium]|nr:SulP family inorganic anion transporter [Coxiellaceae bacterium]